MTFRVARLPLHRGIDISLPPEATDQLVHALEHLEGIVLVTVHRGASVKPPGDTVNVVTRNSEADAVVSLAERAEKHGPVSIATSSVDSLTYGEGQDAVRADVDEAAWEEAETAMRRHTRLTLNFFLTTAGGGLIATAGLAFSSRVTQATALVAAAIIAPVFEPLARIGVAAVNRHGRVMASAALSAAVGYLTVIAAAVLTMLVLRAGGHDYLRAFVASSGVHTTRHPPLDSLLLSAAGAVTGVVMVAAGRFTQLAGPLVAVQLLPAAATLGAALELGHGGLALHSLARLGIDIGMVLVAALIVFSYKHVVIHSRRRMPH